MQVWVKMFVVWLGAQTAWLRYLVIAAMVHVGLLFVLASIRIAVAIPTIVAAFSADNAPPPKPPEDVDPFAAFRDFEYNGPTLGGGGGTPGKGPGGIPTAAGTTPTEYRASVLDNNPRDMDKTVGEVIGVDVGDSAAAIARLQGGPGSMMAPTMGLGEGKFGTAGVRGPGGGGFGQRCGPIRSKRTPPEAERAVMAALRWLKQHQKADGSWESSRPQAISGLATLAFLGHGETPDSEEFGATVGKALKYLVSNINENGQVSASGHMMYDQAIVTYAIAEGYGMTQSPALKEPLYRTVSLLLRAQQVPKKGADNGGWRYTPGSVDADVSVSGWCIQALHAAKLAGADVSDSNLELAAKYLWQNFSGGVFGYANPGGDIQARKSTTAIGVLCQAFLGNGGDARCKQALDLLAPHKFNWDGESKKHTAYHWYYMTQAMYQGGGNYWIEWDNTFRNSLIKHQAEDGHWPPAPQSNEGTYGAAYTTSLCCLMLEVYYRYLPTYQSIEHTQVNKPVGSNLPTLPNLKVPPKKNK
jgi:hypothetical protein